MTSEHVPVKRPSTVSRVLGVLGEVCLTLGVLLGLYVVWQLFWTDVQSGRAQDEILASLDFDDYDNVTKDIPEAEEGEWPPLLSEEYMYRDTPPPVMETPEFASSFATFYVPRWGDDYVKPISEGTTRKDVLDEKGIGRYVNTQMPGELGNFAISAHRNTYAKPFADVDKLQPGDPLVVLTKDAWYVYRVTESLIVLPHQVEVIAPMPGQPGVTPDDYYITLTSCHPKFSAKQRFIVHGELDYWAPVGHGYPPEIAGSIPKPSSKEQLT